MLNRDLFRNKDHAIGNFLPYDGCAEYYGVVLPPTEADTYLHVLCSEIDWQRDRALLFGKEVVTRRKVAWHAARPFRYSYSGITRTASPWTQPVLALKEIVENICNEQFNSCLLNLYHNGREGMAWHSDNEPQLQRHAAIASLSFGAMRKFSFKHKTSKQTLSLFLEHGSLLVMKDDTQSHWLHRLPETKKVFESRVNLTFRKMA